MIRPRVLLADDHIILLDAFRKLLEPECEVVGTVTDGRALLEVGPTLNPDIIVLDMAMPLLNGLDAGRQLRQRMPNVKLIFLTVNEDPELAAEAFRIGASGYLLKNSAASELFHAIREASKGRVYVTPLVAKEMVDTLVNGSQRRKLSRDLTSRQREVLQLLAEGRSMQEVATLMKITPRTVAFHKYRIMDELHLKTNAALVQFAIKQGLVSG
jgi:DNA-binding NarL/FixJ family response regulator